MLRLPIVGGGEAAGLGVPKMSGSPIGARRRVA